MTLPPIVTLLCLCLAVPANGLFDFFGIFDKGGSQSILPEDYESGTAAEKYAFWESALAGEGEESGNFPSIFGQIKFLTTDKLGHTFSRHRDDLPYTHEKRIRSVGGVAMAQWIPSEDDHPFTGIFRGSPFGLVRLSYVDQNDSKGTSPGISLKMFRNGTPSVNVGAFNKLEGQTGGNFFEKTLFHHVAPATDLTTKAASAKFSLYSNPTYMIGISEFSEYTYDGVEELDPVAPYLLSFVPNADLTEQFKDSPPERNLFDLLSEIPVETTLYELYALPTPDSEETVHVGSLKLVTPLKRSKLGDNVLFFRHQKIEEDFAFNPEWTVDFGKQCPVLCSFF